MTRYLLDTTALIDVSKNREPARSRILSMIEAGDELGVCGINVAEFYSGVLPGVSPEWDTFLQTLSYWQITRAAAARAGQDRYQFLHQGRTISTTDVLVAAVARQQGAVLITNNVKDYPMKDITLLPLSDEATNDQSPTKNRS